MAFMILHFYSFCKFLAAVSAVFLIFVLIRRFLRRRNYRLPPGPRGLPVLGHLSIFESFKLFNHRDEYGDVSHLSIFANDVVVLNSVDSIREVMKGKDTSNVVSLRPPSYVSELVYEDVLFESPSLGWKQLKHTAHSLLKQHGDGILELENVVLNELEYMTDLLEESIDQKVESNDFIKPFAMNVLLMLAIGERLDYEHELLSMGSRATELGAMLANPFVDTTLKMMPFIKYLPISLGKAVKEVIFLREKLLDELFYRHKHLSDDELRDKKGIVFDLIKRQRAGDNLNDDKIRGIVLDIMSAGFGTTAGTLSAFFLIVFKFPHVQTEIQNEIDKHIGRERRPTLADRQNMPYTRAAILELLRYTSILPTSVPHYCAADAEVFGYTIPSGSILLPNFFRVHHDEEYWKNPWEFDPNRFLDEEGELLPANHPIRSNLIPFGIGKRVCMGEVFAKTRIFLFVAFLLQRFTFSAADDIAPSCDPRDYISDIIIRPNPYKLIIKQRT